MKVFIQKLFTKFLSVFLVVVLVLASMPLAVFAVEAISWNGAAPDLSAQSGEITITISKGATGTLIVPANSTVTVTGGSSDTWIQDAGQIAIEVPETSTVIWQVIFWGTGSPLIDLHGDGTFQVGPRGVINNRGSGNAINVNGNNMDVIVTGDAGSISAVSAMTGTAIECEGEVNTVTIEGNAIIGNESASNIRPIINMSNPLNTGDNVFIEEGAHVWTLGPIEHPTEAYTYAYAVQTYGNVVMTGGDVWSGGKSGRAINLIGNTSKAIISGGTVRADGANGVAISTATTFISGVAAADAVANTEVIIRGNAVVTSAANYAIHTTGKKSQITVSGNARVSTGGSGDAICAEGNTSTVKVTVEGGVVSAENGYAVRTANSAVVSVTGGLVFAYNTSAKAGDTIKDAVYKTGFAPSGAGTVVAWNYDAGQRLYAEADPTDTHLTIADAEKAGVMWHNDPTQGGGISYGGNRYFFKLPVEVYSEYGLIYNVADSKMYIDMDYDGEEDGEFNGGGWTGNGNVLRLNQFYWVATMPDVVRLGTAKAQIPALRIIGDVTIELTGQSTIISYVKNAAVRSGDEYDGIYSEGDITIKGTGDGLLTVAAFDRYRRATPATPVICYGLRTTENLTIESGLIQSGAANFAVNDISYGIACDSLILKPLQGGGVEGIGYSGAFTQSAQTPILPDAYSYRSSEYQTELNSVAETQYTAVQGDGYDAAFNYNSLPNGTFRQVRIRANAFAVISADVVTGVVGKELLQQTAEITLYGTVLNENLNADARGWFSSIPSGVTVMATGTVGDNRIMLTFGGIPMEVSDRAFDISVPRDVLNNSASLVVSAGGDAKFDITDPQPISHTVTYSANYTTVNGEGGIMLPDSVTDGGRYTVAENRFTRKGYNFIGWNIAPDGTGTSYTSGAEIDNVTSDIMLYAQWEQEVFYKVTYNANGGVGNMQTDEVTKGWSYAIKTSGFIRLGYDFDGWDTQEDGNGTSYVGGDIIPAINTDIVLYAQWREKTYIVRFDGNAPDITGSMGEQQFTFGTEQSLTTNAFTRNGYSFAGWNTQPDGNGKSYSDRSNISVAENLTLYAQWRLNDVAVVFMNNYNVNDQTHYVPGETANQDTCFGDILTTFVEPTRVGYTFDGWFDLREGGTEYIPGSNVIDVDGVLTLYARWMPNTYTVSFDGNAPDVTGSMGEQQFAFGTEQSLSVNIFTRTGYSFAGWSTQANGSGTHYPDGYKFEPYNLANNLTLHAQWTPMDIVVEFLNNYGANDETHYVPGEVANSDKRYQDLLENFDMPVRVGYTFDGWFDLREGGIEYIPGSSVIDVDGVLTLYARWMPNTYTVNFDGNAPDVTGSMGEQQFAFGTEQSLSANVFSRPGYVFSGWNTATDGSGTAYMNEHQFAPWSFTSGLTLYAQWKTAGNVYTVNYYSNGGTGSMVSDSVAHGGTYVVRSNGFTYQGHAFAGWKTEMGETSYVAGELIHNVTSNIYLYAEWTPGNGSGGDVGGEIGNGGDKPIEITVGLYEGDSNGYITHMVLYIPAGETVPYSFNNISDGWYNVVAMNTRVESGTAASIIRSVHVVNGAVEEKRDIKYIPGHYEFVEIEDGQPPVSVDGLDALIDRDEEDTSLDEEWLRFGGIVQMGLWVSSIQEPMVMAMLNNAIEDDNYYPIQTINLEVYKAFWEESAFINGLEPASVEFLTDLDSHILEIVVPLTGGAADKMIDAVYREHGESVDSLPKDRPNVEGGEYFEQDGQYVILHVSKFSGYAFAMKTGNNSGSSGGNSTSSYVTVSFDSNGGNGSKSPERVTEGSSYTLPANPFTRDGYVFVGWKVGNIGYTQKAGSKIIATKSITLYAQWAMVQSDTGTSIPGLLNADEHFAYVQGIGHNLFGPDKGISRAEVAQMFYNLLKDKNVAGTGSFPDVPVDEWYTTAVNAMGVLKIFEGSKDGSFQPARNITRAEFAAIAVRFVRVSPGGTHFSDVPSSHWAADYISTVAEYGWMNGTGEGLFEPDRAITRGEAVTIVNRMLNRRADKEFIDANTSLTRYPDVTKEYWAYYEIMEASNAHTFEIDNGSEQWTQ